MAERKPLSRPARERVAALSTGATASAVVLPALGEPRPTLGDLEATICALGHMADLVREDTICVATAPGGCVTLSEATHWGLLQVLFRVADLKEEFYALLHGSLSDA